MGVGRAWRHLGPQSGCVVLAAWYLMWIFALSKNPFIREVCGLDEKKDR
jgi:hypothetical protein